RLQLSSAAIARIIGLSPASISRIRKGQVVLEPGTKPFELAALFVRVYRAVDAITGGDDAVSAKWLDAPNTALRGKPIDLIQEVAGLFHVVQYLDSRRAII